MQVSFVGIDGYEQVRPLLELIFASHMDFQIAISEAVCNAIRYGFSGLGTKVVLRLSWTDRFAVVKVSSCSPGFDVLDYVDRLRGYENDWMNQLRSNIRGRGIWLMLAGCRKVIYHPQGTEVILATPLHPLPSDRLLSRLRVCFPAG